MAGSSKKTKDSIPVLNIREFLSDQEAEPGFQYHEISGARSIEKFHKHDFFLFLLFEKGSGTHSIDFTDHKITDHQVHILFPHQVHKWNLGARTKAYQLMISKRIFETFSASLDLSFLLYQSHPVVQLTPKAFHLLFYEFQSIRMDLKHRPISWDLIYLRSNIIAQLVNREAEQKFKDLGLYQKTPVLQRYLSLVEQHFREEKSVAFYAGLLHITPNYLNILCKRQFQVSAMFFIQKRVTLEAKRMILSTDMSLKEIAFELGFKDPAYFSNFFRAQTGSSPRGFKREL
ncbi:helix-turn-helix domain-containing protein [Pseudoflavitalea rhizosphaerae]|uniref:helix-turn-helix domain-containing protein n=1 Tax=Pseudoflavitalea rhizosphaerae TaxID=1884793 RepID=UPI000F8E4A8D|nr:helix-turn-helix domain-containing protein [Pseudoflavitalea rhizosphaerae]